MFRQPGIQHLKDFLLRLSRRRVGFNDPTKSVKLLVQLIRIDQVSFGALHLPLNQLLLDPRHLLSHVISGREGWCKSLVPREALVQRRELLGRTLRDHGSGQRVQYFLRGARSRAAALRTA